jgi:hypothetical protein
MFMFRATQKVIVFHLIGTYFSQAKPRWQLLVINKSAAKS